MDCNKQIELIKAGFIKNRKLLIAIGDETRQTIITVLMGENYSISGKCTGCGTCVKVCQADNIVMDGGKLSFQHKCYRCMACIQYCPRNAILVNGKETSARKYTHPDYPAAEMIRILHECSS